MQSLGQALAAASGATGDRQPTDKRRARRYRGGVGFVMDPLRHSSKLDGNQRARIMVAVEAMERSTKAKGRRNGLLGYVGVQVLRCLLFRFHGKAGLCCPSIDKIQEATGLCRQSVVEGLRRLEAAKVVTITRRLVRIAMIGSDGTAMSAVRQGSNLYAFQQLGSATPVEATARGFKLPRVYGAGSNHKQPVQSQKPLSGLSAFGFQAIMKRRALAGWQ